MDVKQAARQQSSRLANAAAEAAPALATPPEGWLRTVRRALGMSGAQLARRLNVSRARISNLEQAECAGAVTIKSMETAAAAMGCRFIYAVVPIHSVEDVIGQQAALKAAGIAGRAGTHMALENQAPSHEQQGRFIRDLADQFRRDMPSHLWDD